MKTSANRVIPALIAALLLCNACGSGLKRRLVGKWDSLSAGTVWEFISDGSVRVTSKSDGKELSSGTYKVIDEETLELSLSQQRGLLKANVQTVSPSELKISGIGIPPFVLKRIS